MYNFKNLIKYSVISTFFLGLANPALATPITYNISISDFDNSLDYDTNALHLNPSLTTLTGSITTDGTIGDLSSTNITDWTFTISDETGANTISSNGSIFGPATTQGLAYLTATSTGLFSRSTVDPDYLAAAGNIQFWRFSNSPTQYVQLSSGFLFTMLDFTSTNSLNCTTLPACGTYGQKTLSTSSGPLPLQLSSFSLNAASVANNDVFALIGSVADDPIINVSAPSLIGVLALAVFGLFTLRARSNHVKRSVFGA